MMNGGMHVPKFTAVIPCPFSCVYPNIYEKSVFKTILLYTGLVFFLKQLLSFFRKAVTVSLLPKRAQQLGSTTAGQTAWVLSPLHPYVSKTIGYASQE